MKCFFSLNIIIAFYIICLLICTVSQVSGVASGTFVSIKSHCILHCKIYFFSLNQCYGTCIIIAFRIYVYLLERVSHLSDVSHEPVLFVLCPSSHSRSFHYYGHVTVTGEEFQHLTYTRY